MPSIPQALLAAVLLAAWAGCEGIQFSSPEHLAPLLIVIGCGVLAWRERSRLLLAVSLAAFSLSLIFVLSTATGYGGDAARLVFATLFNLGAALIAAGTLARAGRLGRFAESASVLAFFGWLPVLVIGYLFSFRELGHELFRHNQGVTSLAAWAYLLPAFVANLGLWGWALTVGRRAAGPGIADSAAAGRRPGWELVLLPLAGLYFVLAGGAGWVFPGPAILFTVGIFNLILLAVAAMSMLRGCRTGNGRQALAGSVLFLALVVARYFDLFHSQLTRGVVFLAVGALFTVEAVAYARQRAVKTQ